MLDRTIAQKVLDLALAKGADFADIFVERNQSLNLTYLDRKCDSIKTGIDFGIGVRLISGKDVVYGYTNSPLEKDLLTLTTDLADIMGSSSSTSPLTTALKPQQFHRGNPAVLGLNQDEISLEEKIAFLASIDQAARKQGDKIIQVVVSGLQRWQEVEIFNTEGLHIGENRHYTRFMPQAIASDGTAKESAFTGPGATAGWEFAKSLNPESLGEEVARLALQNLLAAPAPAGKTDVIIENGFGGVIFHEACGHLLETTSVQKKSSVFWDKMNQQIASDVVSAVDEGQTDKAWGSLKIDDEGMETRRTQLIKEGKLVAFLSDRVGELKTDHPRTGSGRRQSYKFAPASRMRNTYIEPGKSTLDEILAATENGIYAKTMGGGSVDPGTGEFNFNVIEGYLVKKGKIQEPIKGATLIGTGPEVLKNIDMVGQNFELGAGMCGSVSGAVPVTVGQPALRVKNILVGGKS